MRSFLWVSEGFMVYIGVMMPVLESDNPEVYQTVIKALVVFPSVGMEKGK